MCVSKQEMATQMGRDPQMCTTKRGPGTSSPEALREVPVPTNHTGKLIIPEALESLSERSCFISEQFSSGIHMGLALPNNLKKHEPKVSNYF